MMKRTENKSHIEGLLVLVLFGVFAICILAVLLSGAGSYERLVERQQNGYAERTVPQYIATKIRQADAAGAVSVREFDGIPTLELAEMHDGEQYVTRIYCYDGYLRELFSDTTGNFQPGDGERILETEQVKFTQKGNSLEISVTGTDGETTELKLTLRSIKGGYRE